MKGKPGKTQTWLPSQVHYGVDCSDSDPNNWKPFGSYADQLAEGAAKKDARQGVKGDHPEQ